MLNTVDQEIKDLEHEVERSECSNDKEYFIS